MTKTVTLAVVAITLLLLPACGARPAGSARVPATTTGNIGAQSSGSTSPDIAGTVVALGASFTPTPTARPSGTVQTPEGPAATEGLIFGVSGMMVPLDELRDRSLFPDGADSAPYHLFIGDDPEAAEQIGDTFVWVSPDARIYREQAGQLAPATTRDLRIGQRIAARLGSVRLSYPGRSSTDIVVIRDLPLEKVNPPEWPDEIYSLGPREGESACPNEVAPSVAMYLHEAGRKDGLADPSRFKLVIDGKDVTAVAFFQGTPDLPQSEVHLQYRKGLKLGRHTASITFPLENGWMRTYTWTFRVERTYEYDEGQRAEC